MARVPKTSSGSKLANFIGENWLIVTSFPNCGINAVRKNTRMKSAAFIKRSSTSSLNSESLHISLQVAAYCLDCGKNRKILSVQQHPHLVVRTADLHVLCVPNRAGRAAGKELLLADSCEFGKSNSRPQSKQTLYVRCLIVNTRLR